MESGLISFLPVAAAHFFYPSLTTKCLPIWLLALRTYILPSEVCPDKTISYGLAISSIGDACLYLEIGQDGDMKEYLFLLGLLCFLMAHFVYEGIFTPHKFPYSHSMLATFRVLHVNDDNHFA